MVAKNQSVTETGPPPDNADRRAAEVAALPLWLRKVKWPILCMYLQDALWKGQLQDTEMYRMFLIEHYKHISVVPVPSETTQYVIRFCCPECAHVWSFVHSCACDATCPNCYTKDITPQTFKEIT